MITVKYFDGVCVSFSAN